MILCCGDRAQHAIRDRVLREFPVLFDNIELWAVRGKIMQAQRFAARAAKPSDAFAPVPRRVVNEKNQARVFCEQRAHKPHECSLCLSCDETKDEGAWCARADDVEAFARVIRAHDRTASFQRPSSREVGRDDDRALVQTRDRPPSRAVESGGAFCFFLNCCCTSAFAL